jgi:protein kinase A
MGNCVFKDVQSSPDASTETVESLLAKNHYEKKYVVGRGGFGKVWKVQSKINPSKAYALKEMSKARVIFKKSIDAVLIERELLEKLSHPLIVNMVAAFQDRSNLYLVMDYCSGGDLRY